MRVRVAALVGLTALGAAAQAVPAGATPRDANSCTNITGTVAAFAIPVVTGGAVTGFTVIGTGSGSLAGAVTASLVIERVLPGGTMKLTGTHTYVSSPVGSITLQDRVVVTPSGHLSNTSQVVSAGKSGFLHSVGTINPATGAVQLSYHGRICSD